MTHQQTHTNAYRTAYLSLPSHSWTHWMHHTTFVSRIVKLKSASLRINVQWVHSTC